MAHTSPAAGEDQSRLTYGLKRSFAVQEDFSHNQRKSASCAEDWSFANSQGSWSNGPGNHSCSGGGCAYVARRSILQEMA